MVVHLRKFATHIGNVFETNGNRPETCGVWRESAQSAPGSTTRAMSRQMSLVHQRRLVISYGISACAGCLCDVADRDTPTFAAELKNLHRQLCLIVASRRRDRILDPARPTLTPTGGYEPSPPQIVKSPGRPTDWSRTIVDGYDCRESGAPKQRQPGLTPF